MRQRTTDKTLVQRPTQAFGLGAMPEPAAAGRRHVFPQHGSAALDHGTRKAGRVGAGAQDWPSRRSGNPAVRTVASASQIHARPELRSWQHAAFRCLRLLVRFDSFRSKIPGIGRACCDRGVTLSLSASRRKEAPIARLGGGASGATQDFSENGIDKPPSGLRISPLCGRGKWMGHVRGVKHGPADGCKHRPGAGWVRPFGNSTTRRYGS